MESPIVPNRLVGGSTQAVAPDGCGGPSIVGVHDASSHCDEARGWIAGERRSDGCLEISTLAADPRQEKGQAGKCRANLGGFMRCRSADDDANIPILADPHRQTGHGHEQWIPSTS